jgi:hypothetical protein
VWCLDSQIQHKVAVLKEHVLTPGRPPAVILAHSIGSYIMLQAVKQLEQEMQEAGTHLQQQLPKVRVTCLLESVAGLAGTVLSCSEGSSTCTSISCSVVMLGCVLLFIMHRHLEPVGP